jgi:signal peptidase I
MFNFKSDESKNQIYFGETDQSEPSKIKKAILYILEIIKIVLISLAIILPVRYFLIQPFYVKGASMEPNFYDHEYLIINEISYRFSNPQRGDIVVFKYPRDPDQFFIKRIIALPGETVEIHNGQVIIFNNENPDGVVLKEDYLDEKTKTQGEFRVTLGEDEYFVLGDNRVSSYDSRIFGPVKRNLIVGRVWFRGWPFSKIGFFEAPEYNF